MNGAVKRFKIKRIGRTSGVVHEHVTTVDAEDAHLLRSSYWVIQINNQTGHYYITRKTPRGTEFLHHVIVGAEPGEPVVHINGDSLDNRKANLLRRRDRVEEIE